MPFDGHLRQEDALVEKIDRVIAFFDRRNKWSYYGPFSLRRTGGVCLMIALGKLDAVDLEDHILFAAKQLTGRWYGNIPDFNDSLRTTFRLLRRVLWRTRDNLIRDAEANRLTCWDATTAEPLPAFLEPPAARETAAAMCVLPT